MMYDVAHVLKLHLKSSHTNLRVDNGGGGDPLYDTSTLQSTHTLHIFV